jgi:hypothetical protein
MDILVEPTTDNSKDYLRMHYAHIGWLKGLSGNLAAFFISSVKSQRPGNPPPR